MKIENLRNPSKRFHLETENNPQVFRDYISNEEFEGNW